LLTAVVARLGSEASMVVAREGHAAFTLVPMVTAVVAAGALSSMVGQAQKRKSKISSCLH